MVLYDGKTYCKKQLEHILHDEKRWFHKKKSLKSWLETTRAHFNE